MKKRIALLLALLLILTFPLTIHSWAEEETEPVTVRVLLGTDGASSVAVTVLGSYSVGDTSFTGGTLTASISNGTITLSHSEKGTLYAGTKSVRVVRNTVTNEEGEEIAQGNDEANLTLTNKGHNAKLTYLGDLVFYSDDGTLRVVNVVGVREYLYGVVSGEVTDSSPEELLKVEAICAKGFALAEVEARTKKDFDVYDTTKSQLYYGYKAKDTKVIAAVDAVWENTLLYQGKVVKTYYCTANGGQAITPVMHWGGTNENEGAYYFGYDPFDLEGSSSSKSLTIDGADPAGLSEKVRAYFVSLAETALGEEVESLESIVSLVGVNDPSHPEGTSRAPSELAPQAQVTAKLNVKTKAGEYRQATAAFDLSDFKSKTGMSGGSVQFVVRTGVQSWVIAFGSNSGHRVGLSHRGAGVMAKKGYTYVEILKFYYRNADLYDANGTLIPCNKTFDFTYSGPEPEATATPSPTPAEESPTPSPTPAEESPTPSPTPAEESPTPSPTPAEESPTPSPTPAEEPPTPSPTPEESPTPSPTPVEESPTPSPTPAGEESPSPSPTPTETPAPSEPEIGDVDGVNGITRYDAQLVMEYYLRVTTLTAEQLARADVNRDGVVDALDAAMLLRIISRG
ncbi:MAG: SpoIID/LytB domain-containing protein [Clostridia bacterium]|nr:SpoIID/LytB domain-containing protein [Clostridia bacterium]